jgi:hypothetical protein
MSLWSSRRVREDNMVACPECGRMFVPRGLAAHRRMRHGPGSPPETDPGTKPGALDTVAITRALDDLARAVGRLDARIDRLLAAPDPAPALPAQSAPKPSARESLERELDELLAEIARVRTEGERALVRSTDAEAALVRSTDAEGALVQATDAGAVLVQASDGAGAFVQAADTEAASELALRRRLGKLRRRQTSILSRLLEIDGDPASEALDCL